MKCPNCGTELKDGRFYCENCGHDIHIVPDFEPELEYNMEVHLDTVSGDEAGDEEAKLPVPPKKPQWRAWALIALLAAGIIFIGVRMVLNHSAEYQAGRARKAAERGRYEPAINYYIRALEIDRTNVELKFDLSDVYFIQNNEEEYERILMDIADDPYADAEQRGSAYGKLIAVYRAREDYTTISELLQNCNDESIRTAYQGYLVHPPEFSVPGGTYDSMTALKLTVTGKGTIYYTVTGDEPDQNSEQYTAPILLEQGRYIVKAVFVSEIGVSSQVVTAEYQIEAEELEMPELNVDSGDYGSPVFITVLNDLENIYYTTDGSEPTQESLKYTEPIPMPLGESFFRFVRLEAGKSSVIVDKTFNLALQTDFSREQAVAKIQEYVLQTGKIRDLEGHFDDTGDVYQYQYLYAANINDVGDFYVIAEVLVVAQGGPARTGNYFAVNVYTGYYYKLQIENGIYTLTELG